MASRLFYVHDPMCSWCYGFGPALERLTAGLPRGIRLVRLLGGLAPDSDEPMTPEMQQHLQQTWHRIEHRIPGTVFDFSFWRKCEPRRSTWPACRAVIAARAQDPAWDEAMTRAIQQAYYRQARNPSDRETLVALAAELGADAGAFAAAMDAPETRQTLTREIGQARALGADSFPALVLDNDSGRWRIPVAYTSAEEMLKTIRDVTTSG